MLRAQFPLLGRRQALKNVVSLALVTLPIFPLAVKSQCEGGDPCPTDHPDHNTVADSISSSVVREVNPRSDESAETTNREEHARGAGANCGCCTIVETPAHVDRQAGKQAGQAEVDGSVFGPWVGARYELEHEKSNN